MDTQTNTTFEQARRNMVDGQLRPGDITDPRVVDAFAEIPRHVFVPAASAHLAYADMDVPVGDGRALLAPLTLARLIHLAALQPSERVLVIGAGTGFGSAVAARLCGTVVAIEQSAALVAQGNAALQAVGSPERLRQHAHTQAVAGEAPFDAIMIEGAAAAIADAVWQQLAPSGRLVTVFQNGGTSRLVRFPATDRSKPATWHDARAPLVPGFEAPRPAFTF